jgi:hypothetical protein
MAAVLFQGIGWADRKIRSNFVRINHGYAKLSKMQKPSQTFRRHKGWHQTSSILMTNKYQVLLHKTLSPGIYTPLGINGKPIEIRNETVYLNFNRIHSAVYLKWSTSYHQPSSVQQLISRLTFELCLRVTLPGFHSYDTALFVSDVTRLYTVTMQLCLWATLPGFPRLGYRFVT